MLLRIKERLLPGKVLYKYMYNYNHVYVTYKYSPGSGGITRVPIMSFIKYIPYVHIRKV